MLSLAGQLRSSVGGLNPTERIRAAYARGRDKLLRHYSGEPCTGRRVVYVVLATASEEAPFITSSANYYFAAVKTGPGLTWGPESVSHGWLGGSRGLLLWCLLLWCGLDGLPRQLP